MREVLPQEHAAAAAGRVGAREGLTPDPARVAEHRQRLPTWGVAADEAVALAEALALEEELLAHPERWLADGPSRVEGLASEAKLRGRWKG